MITTILPKALVWLFVMAMTSTAKPLRNIMYLTGYVGS